jgi:peptidoglycan/LPS O-acetylase OafA/YrhL
MQNFQNRLDLEFLRGFAVLIVFLFHYNNPIFPFYFVGVDIFFLISGYVITQSILQTKDFKLFEFYTKRIKRIYPALSVILSIFIIYYILFYEIDEGDYLDIVFSAVTSFFATSNFYYTISQSFFYFSPEIKFLHHTWSLSVEIQFYILFGFLLYLLINLTHVDFRLKFLRLFLLSIFITSLLLFFISKNNFVSGYYQLPGRLWEFLLGSLIYLHKPKKKFLNFHLLVGFFFLVLLILGFFNFQIDYKILIVLTAIYFAIVITYSNFNNYLIINDFFLFYGKISLSFYLWHLIVISFYKSTFNNIYYDISFNFFISTLLSFITFNYIEKICNKKSTFDKHFSKALKFFTFSFLTLIIFLQIFDKNQITDLRNFVYQKTIQSFNKFKKQELDVDSAQGSYFVFRYDNCYNEYENFSWSKGTNCLIENSNETLFYIMGDSFGDHIVPTVAITNDQITLYKARFENCYIIQGEQCDVDNFDLINSQFLNISKNFKKKFLVISLSKANFSETKIKKLLQIIRKDVYIIFMYKHPSFDEFSNSEMFTRYKLIKSKDYDIINKFKKDRKIYFFDNLNNLCIDCRPNEYRKLLSDSLGHFTLKTSVNLNINFEKFIKNIEFQ